MLPKHRIAFHCLEPRMNISQLEQFRISSGVGLLSGGAQWHVAVIRTLVRANPSFQASDSDCEATPALCRARYSQSPDRSPVNIRPVRFAPFAAGARPTIKNSASGSPNGGTGFPQYFSPSCRLGGSCATDSHHARRRGQRSQFGTS